MGQWFISVAWQIPWPFTPRLLAAACSHVRHVLTPLGKPAQLWAIKALILHLWGQSTVGFQDFFWMNCWFAVKPLRTFMTLSTLKVFRLLYCTMCTCTNYTIFPQPVYLCVSSRGNQTGPVWKSVWAQWKAHMLRHYITKRRCGRCVNAGMFSFQNATQWLPNMLDMSGRIYQMSGRGLLLNSIKCPAGNPKCPAELESFWQSLCNLRFAVSTPWENSKLSGVISITYKRGLQFITTLLEEGRNLWVAPPFW